MIIKVFKGAWHRVYKRAGLGFCLGEWVERSVMKKTVILAALVLLWGAVSAFWSWQPVPSTVVTWEELERKGAEPISRPVTIELGPPQPECSKLQEAGLNSLATSPWPVMGRLSSDFGYRRSPFTRLRRFHEGIDIASPRGTPIMVIADGTVIHAGYRGGLGKTVMVDHGGGLLSVYGHASKLLVSKGDWVERGAVIALVGRTGRCTGSHLHYELLLNDLPLDPIRYFSRN